MEKITPNVLNDEEKANLLEEIDAKLNLEI